MISEAGRDRAKAGVRRARWSVRTRAAEHAGYLVLARRIHHDGVVSEATELVIDGFTRSASTFAVVAFQLAQPAPVRVGHHVHAPSQIIRAARLGVPILLTVRPPEDTILSLVIREPYVTLPQGMTAYTRFYAKLLDHMAAMVVADFAEVTAHLDRSIERVNARFGTAFTPFVPTPQSTRECFELIEMRARRPPWRPTIHAFLSGLVTHDELRRAAASHSGDVAAVPEHRAQRPSAYKEARKDELRSAYHAPELARLRRRADEMYACFAAAAS